MIIIAQQQSDLVLVSTIVVSIFFPLKMRGII